ncbi:MAG: GAF domain-containing protein [Nocardioidaceae bacterium]
MVTHLPLTVASSDALATQLDEVQYGEDKGPCLHALRTGEVTVVTDLATEQRWAPYPAHALALGIRSSLSLPLTVNGDTRGALNLYGNEPDVFGAAERHLGEVFALQASAAMTVVSAKPSRCS